MGGTGAREALVGGGGSCWGDSGVAGGRLFLIGRQNSYPDSDEPAEQSGSHTGGQVGARQEDKENADKSPFEFGRKPLSERTPGTK